MPSGQEKLEFMISVLKSKLLSKNYIKKFKMSFFNSADFTRGFLTSELRVASYELRVTIYCTSYELLFTYELRVITYCTSYELIFTYELQVTIYCTSYKLN